jgi:hypothetical protein
MTTTIVQAFLSGALCVAFAAIGMFFFRFWKTAHDRFFAIFAAAFWVLALERVILLVVGPEHEMRPFVYVVRLVAFLIIIAAIIDKNRTSDG